MRWSSENNISPDEVADFESRLPDYAHINSVFMDNNGDFIMSLRWTNSIVKFDGQTGKTLWKLGGLKSDFEIDDHWGGPCGQHTARLLENGNLIYYDNGTSCPDLPEYSDRPASHPMRYVEYELDQEARTAKLVREIVNEEFANGPTGSVAVLPNENRLISWGLPARAFVDYSTQEFDPDGNLVREYELDANGVGFFSYRANYAEDPNYPTLAEDQGASHQIEAGMYLGKGVSADDDGEPGVTSGDEDGVTFVGDVIPGRSATVKVRASKAGKLNAWIDFNNDGDWSDPGEQIFNDSRVTKGTNKLEFSVPADADPGSTFSRFRYSRQTGLSPRVLLLMAKWKIIRSRLQTDCLLC